MFYCKIADPRWPTFINHEVIPPPPPPHSRNVPARPFQPIFLATAFMLAGRWRGQEEEGGGGGGEGAESSPTPPFSPTFL